MQTKKIDENTIEITKTIEPEPIVTTQTYQLDFLLSQKISIQKQKDDFDSLRDAELAQVNSLIDECNKLGIVEPTQPDVIPTQDPLSIQYRNM